MGTAFLMGQTPCSDGGGGSSCLFHSIESDWNDDVYSVYPDSDGGVQVTSDIYLPNSAFNSLSWYNNLSFGYYGESQAFYSTYNGDAYVVTKFPLYDDDGGVISGGIAIVRRLWLKTEE